MIKFLTDLIDIIRLRKGPQDLPVSWPLVILVIALNIALGVFLSQQVSAEAPGEAPGLRSTVADSALQILLVSVVLNLRNVFNRLPQTLLAMSAAGLLLAIPLLLLLPYAAQPYTSPVEALAALGVMAVFVWSFAVDGHIFRHALSVTMATGVALAIGLFLIRSIAITFI